MRIPDSIDQREMQRFLDTYLYTELAFLVDEIVAVDREASALHTRMDTRRELPVARHQLLQRRL